ncbi:DUF2391 family protein [Prosthecochloris sp. N3]|uniref:DUF2391 family protein n=1 Tax=Prosthecochloris ethylica TaxID=2743976 RepID=A0ABR9XPH4_9CHLB|nr:DUF2391 family protein [Prosthecochloris sp. ZM_2]MBF0586235.1 DUF2391 family protein [Prosthecochloris ethylica]MEC9487667.1 DUF2391 family protein [Prosthecochloris sp.]MBF0635941.1 DUF2391 family protein [Prosthecochloris ethylica]NUK47384.1 DUF2391 family protein [Prosthecochloris ethylica]RNA64939.1 DUF2391 family protein [Prosthecochloris sp. ZM_2]
MQDNKTNFEDIGQVIIGAAALSVPIAFSEESWHFGQTLPPANLFVIVLLSLGFIMLFAYQSIFQGRVSGRIPAFLFRSALDYLITLAVVAIVLLALDRLPLLQDPSLALKRMIVISFPASMGAVVVDAFDKE